MTTTTIRIEEDLKARVAAAADLAGKTAHACIVDAIAQTVAQAELEEELHRVADRRWAKVLATGRTVNRTDARSHVDARMRGEWPAKPVARTPRRAYAPCLASSWRPKCWMISIDSLTICDRSKSRNPRHGCRRSCKRSISFLTIDRSVARPGVVIGS